MISGVQEISEVAATYFVAWKNGIALQINDFGKKSISELGGSFVKFYVPLELKGIPVRDPSPKECAYNGKPASNKCYFVGTEVQFWMALLLGGIGGLIVGTAIIETLFYFKFHT